MIGYSTKDPLKLCPCIRAKYFQLLSMAEDADINLVTIETLRDETRQKEYIRIGASQTMNSYHLPQKPNMLSLAFDIAPRDYLAMKLWNPSGPLWAWIGSHGKQLGLTWGGDWTSLRDLDHLQLNECACKDL